MVLNFTTIAMFVGILNRITKKGKTMLVKIQKASNKCGLFFSNEFIETKEIETLKDLLEINKKYGNHGMIVHPNDDFILVIIYNDYIE
jgi:hypothetical protein